MKIMKIKLFFCLWSLLLITQALHAQIVAKTGTTGGGSCTSGGANCPLGNLLNISVGDTVVIALSSATASSNPSIAGCGLTLPAPIVNNTNGSPLMRLYVVQHATTAQTACQITVSSITGATSVVVQVYSGVLAFGSPVVNGNVTGNAVTLSAPAINADQAGNYIVGMFATNTSNGTPFTPVGITTYRRGGGAGTTGAGVAIGDIAATSPGQAAIVSLSPNVPQNYKSAAIQFTGVPPFRNALLSDAMQTVLMNAPRDMNYLLPQNGLSATWCTWFMPTGSATNIYELEPTTTSVNGQSNHIRIPSWQMTRICQDGDGDFWASPPLREGVGIHIVPSPTAITISSSAGDMSYIAGGVSHTPGNVALPAGSCATLYTSTGSTSPSAAGILATDVVSWSLQTAVGGSGWAETNFYPQPAADSILWRGCNTSAASVTPSARDINWYVARPSAAAVAAHGHRVEARHRARPAKR
jgi:hypothetical protein